MKEKALFDDVFSIPYKGKHIIYIPLKGIVLLGNAAFVNLLYQARQSDSHAREQLGMDNEILNALFESQHLLEQLRGPRELPSFKPTSVSLFLTNDCTLRCRYCYANGGDHHTQMPWDMVTGILDQVLENVLENRMDHMTVHFHGGGDLGSAWPLLVRTREYLSEICSPHNIRLTTSAGLNGFLEQEQREWITRNVDSVTVSIDGPEDIQNFLRPGVDGGPSFPKVRKTIQFFDEVSYPYGIRTTVTRESVTRLEEIISFFCQSFKGRQIKVEPMFPRGRGYNSEVLPPDAESFVTNFRKAQKIAKKFERELCYSGARTETLSCVFCQASGDSCAVTPDGWVTSCYEVLTPSDPLSGTFFYGRYDPVQKKLSVDNNRRRELFNLNVLNKSHCSKCFCKFNCAGDCPVKAIHTEGSDDPELPDRCLINRELTKDQLIDLLEGK
jgi:uncharacterized protein